MDLILGVLCEVRGAGHYEQHGGFNADSAWHVAHGERPSCRGGEGILSVDWGDGTDDKPAPVQSDRRPSRGGGDTDFPDRDKFGFGCTIFGCG